MYAAGEDYVANPTDHFWYFPTLDESITIQAIATFPTPFVGAFEMTNYVELWQDQNKRDDATDTVKGNIPNIVASKSGVYDPETKVVKWTAILNPVRKQYDPDIIAPPTNS